MRILALMYISGPREKGIRIAMAVRPIKSINAMDFMA
jgi:hypothetical protein